MKSLKTNLSIFISIAISALIFPATYKSKSIDGQHFSARLKMEGSDKIYQVDVVFIKSAANIVFPPGLLLPLETGGSHFLTLYLEKEEITDLHKIRLKQVSPPLLISDQPPQDWEANAWWILDLEI